jgi:type VI protein secretion system component VasA
MTLCCNFYLQGLLNALVSLLYLICIRVLIISKTIRGITKQSTQQRVSPARSVRFVEDEALLSYSVGNFLTYVIVKLLSNMRFDFTRGLKTKKVKAPLLKS